jgi:hypothetical protein
MKANMKANIDKNHDIKEKEAHLYHVKLTSRENNPQTKQYDEVIKVQKFTVKDFKQMDKNKFLAQNFYKVEVLHNPEIVEVATTTKQTEATSAADTNGAGAATTGTTKTAEKTLSKKKEKELLADLQIQYKEKYGEEADQAATIEDLKELLN